MLLPHVKGGARRLKASERAIAQVAAQQKTVSNNRFDKLLSGETYLAIGEGARRDHYGNIPRSEYVRILSRLKAFTKQGSAHNETARSNSGGPGNGRTTSSARLVQATCPSVSGHGSSLPSAPPSSPS